MIKINRKLEYALMVLKSMQDKALRGETLTTAREICEEFHTPFDTTSKVMQQMKEAGILESQKGVKGGYTLLADLSKFSYLNLVEKIEGKTFMMDCHDGPCDLFQSCNITQPIRRLNDYLISIFSSLTLSELLAPDNLLALKKIPESKVDNCPIMVKASNEDH
jgi:Rrf2 family protein